MKTNWEKRLCSAAIAAVLASGSLILPAAAADAVTAAQEPVVLTKLWTSDASEKDSVVFKAVFDTDFADNAESMNPTDYEFGVQSTVADEGKYVVYTADGVVTLDTEAYATTGDGTKVTDIEMEAGSNVTVVEAKAFQVEGTSVSRSFTCTLSEGQDTDTLTVKVMVGSDTGKTAVDYQEITIKREAEADLPAYTINYQASASKAGMAEVIAKNAVTNMVSFAISEADAGTDTVGSGLSNVNGGKLFENLPYGTQFIDFKFEDSGVSASATDADGNVMEGTLPAVAGKELTEGENAGWTIVTMNGLAAFQIKTSDFDVAMARYDVEKSTFGVAVVTKNALASDTSMVNKVNLGAEGKAFLRYYYDLNPKQTSRNLKDELEAAEGKKSLSAVTDHEKLPSKIRDLKFGEYTVESTAVVDDLHMATAVMSRLDDKTIQRTPYALYKLVNDGTTGLQESAKGVLDSSYINLTVEPDVQYRLEVGGKGVDDENTAINSGYMKRVYVFTAPDSGDVRLKPAALYAGAVAADNAGYAVTSADVAATIAQLGKDVADDKSNLHFDFNNDAIINVIDLAEVLENVGKTSAGDPGNGDALDYTKADDSDTPAAP